MTKDNEDALRCAERLLTGHTTQYNANEAAAHLRRLVAENEANERNLEQLTDELSGCVKLLRQAVEALTRGTGWMTYPNLIAAIRQHLESKP